jgi:hypothetical protein
MAHIGPHRALWRFGEDDSELTSTTLNAGDGRKSEPTEAVLSAQTAALQLLSTGGKRMGVPFFAHDRAIRSRSLFVPQRIQRINRRGLPRRKITRRNHDCRK